MANTVVSLSICVPWSHLVLTASFQKGTEEAWESTEKSSQNPPTQVTKIIQGEVEGKTPV